jgi:hypothetical protein
MECVKGLSVNYRPQEEGIREQLLHRPPFAEPDSKTETLLRSGGTSVPNSIMLPAGLRPC